MYVYVCVYLFIAHFNITHSDALLT